MAPVHMFVFGSKLACVQKKSHDLHGEIGESFSVPALLRFTTRISIGFNAGKSKPFRVSTTARRWIKGREPDRRIQDAK